MSAKDWNLEVRRTGDGAQLRLAHPSGLCRQWNGDLACQLCERLGLDSDRLLIEHGLRPTAARRAIAARLFDRPQHVTAESLAADLARAGARYSLATVNRILREFVDWDLLQVHDLGGGVVFYDTVTTPHPHIYNEDTGELLDLSREQAWIRGFPQLPEGVRLQGVQLVFRVRQLPGTSGASL